MFSLRKYTRVKFVFQNTNLTIYSHFLRLKKIICAIPIISINIKTATYPQGWRSSGILYGNGLPCLSIAAKFIPYRPAIKVSGIKTLLITVSTFITSLSLLLTVFRYISIILCEISLLVSIKSIICTQWS